MKLNEVQFYGRTAEDALQMFGLSDDYQDIKGRTVLDCPGGPSSLTATLAAEGVHAVACDPLYALSDEQLRHNFCASLALLRSITSTPDDAYWLDQKHLNQESGF